MDFRNYKLEFRSPKAYKTIYTLALLMGPVHGVAILKF